jgi:hypothetical protein
MNIKLTYEDQKHFKNWLELNLDSISWEGRYLEDFNQVWELIFEPEFSIEQQFDSLKKLEKVLTQGPMISWFKWIKQKLVCFLYVYKDLSLRDLVQISKMNSSSTSLVVRDFLIERYPHLEELINEKFQIGSVLSENLDLRYKDIAKELNLDLELRGNLDGDVLTSLEVTLYTDWAKLKNYFVENKSYYKNAESVLKDKNFINRQVKFLRELVLLFLIGGLLIFLIKVGNKTYEEYLVEKISLFSPNFFWLDKNLSFRAEDYLAKNDLEIKLDQLDELEKLESKKVFADIQSKNRYEVESDVVLTSVDTLPKDFSVAGLEQSNYEEVKKGGFRNSRYGRRKAYRVMMTSVNPDFIKKELVTTLKKYKVKQVDNVKPGTHIPGGLYFNLYVPRSSLKEFLSKVSSFEEQSTILESRTVFGGPANMDKVFIWIKSI